jgi:hypothetical protein
MYSQALEATEYEYQTLAKDKRIANMFEFKRRRLNLTHAHHIEVASLEPEEVCGKREKRLRNMRVKSPVGEN